MKIRKFVLPAVLAASAVLTAGLFGGCSSKTEGDGLPEGTSKVPLVETAYVEDMLDNLLLIKMFLENYQLNNGYFPDNLKPLNYPGLQLFSTGGSKDTVIGSLPEKYFRVRYEPTSFGNESYPLIYMTYVPDNKTSSAGKYAALQYAKGEFSCVANVDAPNANAACLRFKAEADKTNPLKNFYSLAAYIGNKNMEPLTWKLQELLQEASKNEAEASKKAQSGLKVSGGIKVSGNIKAK